MKMLTAKSMVLAGALGLGTVSGAMAADYTAYIYGGSFDDATFAVESAIVGRGLVIDYVSHTGEMLARTGQDVGSDVHLFDGADVFLFCSAVVSRKVMEVNPMNVAHCPYSIFVIDQAGEVQIGYRHYPAGEMQQVQTLLDDIVRDAVAF
ncbi:MAG: hypothetical protein ACJA1E_002052 [Paracoccaceae bacterium]|jgi:uncharacterized protein (DUF302 family)